MPITKNHAKQSNTSKMYEAVKGDNIDLIQDVESNGGDIYDHKGNGKFFTRALASNAINVIAYYHNKPDFHAQVKKYKSIDFYAAINYATLDTLKEMARIGLDKSVINIEDIISSKEVVKSQAFLLKAKVFAFISDKDYYAELNRNIKAVSDISFFYSALFSRNFELFIFAYKNKAEMGLSLSYSSINYVLERFNYAYEKDQSWKRNSDVSIVLSEEVLGMIVKEFEAICRCESKRSEDIKVKVGNAIANLAPSIRVLCAKPIDPAKHARDNFMHSIITQYKDSEVARRLVPYFKAELLANRDTNKEYLDANKEALATSEPLIINLSQESLKKLMSKRDDSCEFDDEAFALGQQFLERTLQESGIDISDPKACIQKSGKESFIIKQAILSYFIRTLGLESTLALVKHISFLKPLYEIGYNPYEIIPFTKNSKLITRLMDDLTKY